MSLQSKARITALGAYVPEKRLTNSDLEKMVDTNDEWIVQRTGIHERRITGTDEHVSHLSIKAVEDLVDRFSVDINDIDLIITATLTPDYRTPSVAAIIHGRMDFPETTGVMDLNSACAGFVYALQVANAMITAGQCRKVLVVAGEVLSKITDYEDRNTCILFGDGAGAALMELDEENPGIFGYNVGSQGKSGHKLYCTGLSEQIESEKAEVIRYLHQDGRAVYTFVIRTVPSGMQALLAPAC